MLYYANAVESFYKIKRIPKGAPILPIAQKTFPNAGDL